MKVRALAAVVVAAVLFDGGSSAQAAKKTCPSAAKKAVAATSDVRVYIKGSIDTDYTEYACYVPTGRVTRLGFGTNGSSAPGIADVVLAGRFVAYDEISCEHDDCQGAQVHVLNAKTGKASRSSRAPVGYQGLGSLVLSTSGSAAYIRQVIDIFGGGARTYSVATLVAGHEAVLTSGPDIDPRSLALAPATPTLYWIQAGQAHTATLPN